MDVFPVHCARCRCFSLEPEHLVIEGHLLCGCGGIARALPGERYTSKDETLFDTVVTSLSVADVSSLRAPALAATLHGREALRPGEALSKLAELEPALAVMELIATSEPRLARKAESMFEILLAAIATTRSRSGIVPCAPLAAETLAQASRRS
jgi:hypothetical protein